MHIAMEIMLQDDQSTNISNSDVLQKCPPLQCPIIASGAHAQQLVIKLSPQYSSISFEQCVHYLHMNITMNIAAAPC